MARRSGKNRVTFNVELARGVAMNAADRGVRAAVLEGQRVAQVNILSSDPPRTGRTYPRGNRDHVASAPGESPAPDTGQLRASMTTQVIRRGSEVRGLVFTNLEKAAGLELGTERIAPRPFLSRVPAEFAARLKAAFVRAAKRG